jgi:WD40 repeat protein
MASGFADFDAGHRDLVTVTKFNFYGNRIVTASSDHRMKVWDQKDGEWQLIDTWRAHDAEIRDVSIRGITLFLLRRQILICGRRHGMVHLLASTLAVWAKT